MGLVLLASFIAIGFIIHLVRYILKQDEGSDLMKQISASIREGANSFLKRQYTSIGIYFAVVLGILIWLVKLGHLVIFVPFAFLSGGFFSGLCGFIGMKIATAANARTTQGAKKKLSIGLRIAFSSGAVMGLSVVALALIDIAVWFLILNWHYAGYPIAERMQFITSAMLTFGMGASSVALFARVGGGIYTKAADVGADMVGKIEAGIPEDDPRNPGVIADNVGDNVGDVAGMGADLYESYVGSIIATMALAVAAGLSLQGVFVPLMIAAGGIIASIVGVFLVKTKENASQKVLLRALQKGLWGSSALIAIISFFVVYFGLGPDKLGVYYSVLVGLGVGLAIGYSTELFTSSKYKFVKDIAREAKTGTATLIIKGMSVGMMSTVIPILVICGGIFLSFSLSGGFDNINAGLYGIGIAAVGMLSTLGMTLASDAYGPVADNAGGIAEMSHQKPIVRKRTDALDSLGNTTAAIGKGFAIGSAALTALVLIAAYKEELALFGKELTLSLLDIRVVIGLFLGGMLPYIFCALTMNSVGKTASQVVKEVRRQFKNIKGLMQGKAKADYARVVDITTKAAQKEMIVPALMAIIAPIAVGLILGVEAVAGLLFGALVSGFVLAVFMANAGGAFDNAKKYIEEGNLGGKGSEVHKRAVVGDTVGDPLKDTSGPSLNILIKLMSMVSLVFASFILSATLMP